MLSRSEILQQLAERQFHFKPEAMEKISDLELHVLLLALQLIEQHGSLQSGLTKLQSSELGNFKN